MVRGGGLCGVQRFAMYFLLLFIDFLFLPCVICYVLYVVGVAYWSHVERKTDTSGLMAKVRTENIALFYCSMLIISCLALSLCSVCWYCMDVIKTIGRLRRLALISQVDLCCPPFVYIVPVSRRSGDGSLVESVLLLPYAI